MLIIHNLILMWFKHTFYFKLYNYANCEPIMWNITNEENNELEVPFRKCEVDALYKCMYLLY